MENSRKICQTLLAMKDMAYSIHPKLGNITYRLSPRTGHKEECK